MAIDRETVVDNALTFWQSSKQAHWHAVSGWSMWPFLKDGDSVWIEPLESQPKIGDVVLLRLPNRLLIHRVAEVRAGGSVTAWGDFNLRADPIATPQQIIGVARKICRAEREISIHTVRKLWGRIIIRFRSIVAIFIIVIRKLIRLRRRLRTT